jgi:FAD:protein FMN transferase
VTPGPQRQVTEARNAMGTRFEVVLPAAPEDDPLHLLAAAEEVLDEIERLEAQLSRFRPTSELSGLNARAAFEAVRTEPRLFTLLCQALALSHATEGAFDPTVGPLLEAWGFSSGRGSLPDPALVAEARARTGAGLVELDEEASTVRFLREGMLLDLGAIGKGYALDRARKLLEDAGITRALVHAGTSTVLALGSRPEREGWRIAIRDPRASGEQPQLLGEVELRDRALSVSAPHGRSFTTEGREYGHVLDPRTGEPTRGVLLSAVSHPSATLTDALSTALLVLGAPAVTKLATYYTDADFLLLTDEEGVPNLRTSGPNSWKWRCVSDQQAAI